MTNKIQIEALERICFSREFGGPMEKGDRRTVSDTYPQLYAEAVNAVKHGWAKDVSGQMQTGKRRVIDATLDVDNSNSASSASEV